MKMKKKEIKEVFVFELFIVNFPFIANSVPVIAAPLFHPPFNPAPQGRETKKVPSPLEGEGKGEGEKT